MFNFISGTILGIIIGTVGITNVAQVLNGPIQWIQKTALDSTAQQNSNNPKPIIENGKITGWENQNDPYANVPSHMIEK